MLDPSKFSVLFNVAKGKVAGSCDGVPVLNRIFIEALDMGDDIRYQYYHYDERELEKCERTAIKQIQSMLPLIATGEGEK